VVDAAVGRKARTIFAELKKPIGWIEARLFASRLLASALAASESRYRHLVENAPDIIYRTDAD